MGESILEYFEKIPRLFENIGATDAEKRPLKFSEALSTGIELILTHTARGGKLIFIGNGGSAAIASHQAIDYWKNGGMRAIAFNDASLLTCVSNDFGYPQVFAKPIEVFAEPGDVLMAISSSGRSENILLAVEAARQRGCKIITMSGFSEDNPLRLTGDLNFYVCSDSYGHVEIVHLSLCHCMLDTIMIRQGRA